MAEAFPFDDISPDEKIQFLDAARERHPGPSPEWTCGECGNVFSIETLLVADIEPQCPICGVFGWGFVYPLPEFQ